MMDKQQTQAFINALIKLREQLTDKEASVAIEVYPTLKNDGSLIKVGTRINYAGALWRAAVDCYDTELNNPTNAPTLWEEITYKNGYRMIPEVITVGTAFELNEMGWWKNQLYKSLIANNVWNPEQYAAGWELYNI